MDNNAKNRQIWGNAMRESFFENVQLNKKFSHTSTNFQNVFREAAHVGGWLDLGPGLYHHGKNKVPRKFRGNCIEFRGSGPAESRGRVVVMC